MKKKITLLFVFVVVFINAQQKTTGQLTFVSGLTAELNLNSSNSTVTLVISGPSDRWFGFKLGNFTSAMSATGVDGVYYNGSVLVDGNGGTLSTDATQNWTLQSNNVVGATRTITATRAFNTGDTNDYAINFADTNIDVAAAHGETPNDFSIAYHGVNKFKFVDTPLTVLGIEDFSLKASTLYPNPSAGSFTISTKTFLNSVDVYNINGVLVKSFKVDDTSENIEFNISGLPVGVYLLELKNETEKTWKKVIIE